MNIYEYYKNYPKLNLENKISVTVKLLEKLAENLNEKSYDEAEEFLNIIQDSLIGDLILLESEDYFGTEGLQIE